MPGVIVSDDFVYLHMPKTGGGTIRSVLSSVLPEGYATPGPHPHVHPGWRYIPPEASDLPVLCYIRNPWDWHVSWYMFSSRRKPKQAKLWMSAFGDQAGLSDVPPARVHGCPRSRPRGDRRAAAAWRGLLHRAAARPRRRSGRRPAHVRAVRAAVRRPRGVPAPRGRAGARRLRSPGRGRARGPPRSAAGPTATTTTTRRARSSRVPARPSSSASATRSRPSAACAWRTASPAGGRPRSPWRPRSS